MNRKKIIKYSLAIVIGGLLGYIYWSEIGCNSGGCAITSDPVNSTLYGAVLGGLIVSSTGKDKKKDNSEA